MERRWFLPPAPPFPWFKTYLFGCMLPVIVAIGLLKKGIFDDCHVVVVYIVIGCL